MKLLRVHIISAKSCGGLLDGLDLRFRSPFDDEIEKFTPFCLVGPNGAGKSQFLQVVAEIFQSLIHATSPAEERADGNFDLQFEIEYLFIEPKSGARSHIKALRIANGKKRASVVISRKVDGEWVDFTPASLEAREILPVKIVGYTSGANETLSLPFLISRRGYADEVGRRAFEEREGDPPINDTALMLIDYGTHLEVLVSNLLLGSDVERRALLDDAQLSELHSFRCIVQLGHSAVPKTPLHRRKNNRKGIQLTTELEGYLKALKSCSTCSSHNPDSDTYIFDFYVNAESRAAFKNFWSTSLDLYSALHKLAMLNDLAIPKQTRDRFNKETQLRRFASRLPEPQDEDKVFRFEQVSFEAKRQRSIVDYVSLSDGEHQLAQLLGTMCMVSFPQVLFLLDEPESHFNPQWRVKFLSRVLSLPTSLGARNAKGESALQDCLLTTHSPFVPSDMPREQVCIFGKDNVTGRLSVTRPEVETFGTTFDSILAECFDIKPPISDVPKAKIAELRAETDPQIIIEGMQELGESVEKLILSDRLRQLQKVSGD